MKKNNSRNLENVNLLGKITRVALVLVFGLVLISVTRGIVRLSSSGSRVKDAQTRLDEVKKDKEQLSYELEKVQSEYFREQQPRDKLGMAKEGEIIVVLPEESVLRRLSPRRIEQEDVSLPEPNWKKWSKLFFER